jgi:hypothetical protein
MLNNLEDVKRKRGRPYGSVQKYHGKEKAKKSVRKESVTAASTSERAVK